MTDTSTPNYRLDVKDDSGSDERHVATLYFEADSHDDAIAYARAQLPSHGERSDVYGDLYVHLIGDQASYVDTVSLDDLADAEVVEARRGRAIVVDVAWTVDGDPPRNSRTIRVTMSLGIDNRSGRAVLSGPDGEIGSMDSAAFLDVIAAEFGVVIVPAAERVEVGAAGCGCPITAEVDAGGYEVDGTERAEHRTACWETPLVNGPLGNRIDATDAEISYPLGVRYVSNMDVADPGRFAPRRYAVLGAVTRTEVGNTAIRAGLTHGSRDPGWSQVLHVVLTPAERDRLRGELAAHSAATAPGAGRSETETEYVHVVDDGTVFRMDKGGFGTISIDHPAVEAVLANLRAAAEPVYDRTDPVQVMAARRYAWELDKQVNAGDPAAIARTAAIEAMHS